ncbi:hypothetical protein L9F63_015534 [Diploptera punctata]|nr:hypothetical protein L9F63_015534 [Diploptera punctata]
MKMFTLPAWSMMGFMLVLVSCVFWFVSEEICVFRSLSDCFYSAWAILIANSTPKMPKGSNLRVLLFFYICYCFAMCTIFQVFFTSYLVEPGYENGIDNFEQLLESGFPYGSVSSFSTLLATSDYKEPDRFKLKVDCTDITKCVKRILIDKDVSTLVSEYLPYYIASSNGMPIKSETICLLEGTAFSGAVSAWVAQGNPLQKQLNVILRRLLEGGFLDTYWSSLIYEIHLKNKLNEGENESDMYFVFSMYHLNSVFWMLTFGHTICFMVFLIELVIHKYLKYLTLRRNEIGRKTEMIGII